MKINIIIHSIYGHIYELAQAMAEGARTVAGSEVFIYQVPETLPESILTEMEGLETKKGFAHVPVATIENLLEADAIILGAPTYFGKMSAQMSAFLDQTGSLWANGELINKIGSAFTSTADQNGGQEETLRGIHTTMLHHGMIIVGVPSSLKFLELHRTNEISGGTCYGASSVAGEGFTKRVSANELAIAKLQGRHVAEITQKLVHQG